MRQIPEPGVLIISPIEDKGEKMFGSIVLPEKRDGGTNIGIAVIEKSGSTKLSCHEGAIVYYEKVHGKDVPLEGGVLYKILYETQVILTVPKDAAGEVVRKNMSPEQIKARLDQAERDFSEAEEIARKQEELRRSAGMN